MDFMTTRDAAEKWGKCGCFPRIPINPLIKEP